MHKIAIGLVAAAIATGGPTLTASAIHYKGGDHYRRHGVIDYMSKHQGPRGQLSGKHHGPYHNKKHVFFGRSHGPVYGKHKGPIPHYRGGRISDTWP